MSTPGRSSSGSNTRTISLPRPHPNQQTILRQARRFNAVACGRRWGKTVLGENRAVPHAMAGDPVGWFAPSYKYLYEVWDWFLQTLHPAIARKNKSEWRIELLTGGHIEFWSLKDNPDAGRSRKYKHVVIDEAAKIPDLEKTWSFGILPTLADHRGGADLLSTPRGHDFFWRCFVWGQPGGRPDWRSWQMPTSSNPYIHPDEIESLRRQLPERPYRQELLAEFLEDAGGVFRCVTESIDPGRNQPEPPRRVGSYALGVDLARLEDFTVLTVLDNTGRQVYFERFNQISWERQIAAIKAAWGRYRAVAIVDATGIGDPIVERLQNEGISVEPFVFTNSSKKSLIDDLAMGLERGRLRLMDIPEQTAELQAYQYELTPSRNLRMGAPEGMHDDCVIALALAARGSAQADRYTDNVGAY